jgi:hypothetical protein
LFEASTLKYSYYRAQQELASMISDVISSSHSDESLEAIANEKLDPLLFKMEETSMNDLYEIGLQFRN